LSYVAWQGGYKKGGWSWEVTETHGASSFVLPTTRVRLIFYKQLPAAVRPPSDILFPVIYPNPTKGILMVSAPSERATQVTIYSMLGTAVITAVIQGTTQIDVSKLQSGVYMLSVDGQMRKIVVE
jgi:type IX secretion system substrate protein